MTKVNRHVIFGGRKPRDWMHHVACAVAADGETSPAERFLKDLSEGVWEDDPDARELPDDEQMTDHQILRATMRELAENGVPERASQVNYLEHGVWEFKVGVKRLAFVDTDGKGGFIPKPKIRDRSESDYPDDDLWWFPVLDEHIRLLNAWGKRSQKADPVDIEKARTLGEEDRKHDE